MILYSLQYNTVGSVYSETRTIALVSMVKNVQYNYFILQSNFLQVLFAMLSRGFCTLINAFTKQVIKQLTN